MDQGASQNRLVESSVTVVQNNSYLALMESIVGVNLEEVLR